MNLHDIVQMGGYGEYVWSAYGITMLVFIVLCITSFREHRNVKNALSNL